MIDPIMHERLAIMAQHNDLQINECAARMLEKMIAAEWHEISILLERSERLGKRRKALEADGLRRSAGDK